MSRLRTDPASLWDEEVQQEFVTLRLVVYGLVDAAEQDKARKRLTEIIEAFTQGALGLGYTLRRPPGKSGRKPTTQDGAWLAATVLDDYERILALLRDSRQDFRDRVRPVAQLTADQIKQVFRERRHTHRTGERRVDWIVPLLKDVCHKAGLSDSQMPSDQELERWAKAAIKRRTVALDRLAYEIVAWRWNKLTEQPWETMDITSWGRFTPSKVRHLIQTWRRAENAFEKELGKAEKAFEKTRRSNSPS